MAQDIRIAIADLNDQQLLIRIGEGPSSYQEGIYALYIEEARKRNLNIEQSAIEQVNVNVQNIKTNNLVRAGYALSFVGGLGGFIIAYILTRKNKITKEYKYPKDIRKHTNNFLGISAVMITVGWLIIGLIIRYLIEFVSILFR